MFLDSVLHDFFSEGIWAKGITFLEFIVCHGGELVVCEGVGWCRFLTVVLFNEFYFNINSRI